MRKENLLYLALSFSINSVCILSRCRSGTPPILLFFVSLSLPRSEEARPWERGCQWSSKTQGEPQGQPVVDRPCSTSFQNGCGLHALGRIFGASLIAHDFLIALRTLPENEHKVVAVSSRSLERASEFADRHSIEKAYGSYEDLARDADVEVVYVSSIHPQHAPLCKLALSHGKHVLCEKPMTMNLKETKEVFELGQGQRIVHHGGKN